MFFKITNKEDALKLFRKLSFRLHPDHGGSNELMILLQEAYEEKLKFLQIQSKEQKKKQEKKADKRFYERTTETIRFNDPRIELLYEINIYLHFNEDLKLEFVESINNFFENRGYLTSGQYNALINIYYQFEMDKEQD